MTNPPALDSTRVALLATLAAGACSGIRELSHATDRRQTGGPADLAILRQHCHALRRLVADGFVVLSRVDRTVRIKITPAGRRASASVLKRSLMPVFAVAASALVTLGIGCTHLTRSTVDQFGDRTLNLVERGNLGDRNSNSPANVHCVEHECLSVKTSVGTGYYDDAVLTHSQSHVANKLNEVAIYNDPLPLQAEFLPLADSVQSIKLTVSFGSARSTLSPVARRSILEARPQALLAQSIVVRGSTDAIGDATVNRRLAVARAESVHDELLKLGVAPDRVRVEGCIDCFVASNATRDGRSANRRADVILTMMDAAQIEY